MMVIKRDEKKVKIFNTGHSHCWLHASPGWLFSLSIYLPIYLPTTTYHSKQKLGLARISSLSDHMVSSDTWLSILKVTTILNIYIVLLFTFSQSLLHLSAFLGSPYLKFFSFFFFLLNKKDDHTLFNYLELTFSSYCITTI